MLVFGLLSSCVNVLGEEFRSRFESGVPMEYIGFTCYIDLDQGSLCARRTSDSRVVVLD